ncbi:MAG: thioredoxin family protein [Acidimicrobiia bacterium]
MTTTKASPSSRETAGLELTLFVSKGSNPCSLMRVSVRQAILETRMQVPLVVIDVGDDRQSGVDNGINSTPTLVIARDGVEIGRICGVRSASSIRERLQETVAERWGTRSDPGLRWLQALRISFVVLAGVLLIAACSIRSFHQHLLETSVLSLPTYYLLWTGD